MLRACVNEYLQKLDLSNCGLHALPDDICHLSLLEVFQHTHSITHSLTHPLKYTHAHAHHSSCAHTHQCVYHMYRYASDCKLLLFTYSLLHMHSSALASMCVCACVYHVCIYMPCYMCVHTKQEETTDTLKNMLCCWTYTVVNIMRQSR